MTIELHKVTVRELMDGYVDDVENGVRGYGGRLDIRPPYQREFVYREKERDAVISTVMKGFPLNVMYWVKKSDGEATELWQHFQKVVNWIETYFPKYRREMKGLEWGRLYKEFATRAYNPQELELQIAAFMSDKEVQKKSGIYEYLLSDGARKEKLNLRTFDDDEKREAYERQGGICPVCGKSFEYEEMEGDHIVPWSKGGKTVPGNLQMLCRRCNALKSDK